MIFSNNYKTQICLGVNQTQSYLKIEMYNKKLIVLHNITNKFLMYNNYCYVTDMLKKHFLLIPF